VRFIEDNSTRLGDVLLVPERLTQQEIAERIGGSREMVSRIIKDLSAGGYISLQDKKILVHKKLPANW
jgi:CRP/FNR family cyclic AMP-dependent transcriptional regulator